MSKSARNTASNRGAADWLALLPSAYAQFKRPSECYSMTTDYELCLVETFARHAFTGAGKIVDLGCWFGATTFCLAAGLADNARAKDHRVIDSFDLFIWDEWMHAVAKSIGFPFQYQTGDCFHEDVKKLIAPHLAAMNIRKQDLTDYVPPADPIEFLFVDAMKNWKLADKITASFFPLLIENSSYVVQQDFAYHHPIHATNHLVMWSLRDHFEFVHHVPYSASVMFFCKKAIKRSQLPAFTPELYSLKNIHAAYDYGLQCVSPNMRHALHATKLTFLIERGFHNAAIEEAERYVTNGVMFPEITLADVTSFVTVQRNIGGRHAKKLAYIESLLPSLTLAPELRAPIKRSVVRDLMLGGRQLMRRLLFHPAPTT